MHAEGASDSLMGKAKNVIGGVIGNQQMEAEGKAREVRRRTYERGVHSAAKSPRARDTVLLMCAPV